MKKHWLLAVLLLALFAAATCPAIAVRYVRRILETSGYDAWPYQISDDGYIRGAIYSSFDGQPHIIRWLPDGTMEDLGPGYGNDMGSDGSILGGSFSSPSYIWDTAGNCVEVPASPLCPTGFNDVGQFVGAYGMPDGGMRAYIWTEQDGVGEMNAIPGCNNSYTQDINNAGIAIGMAYLFQNNRYANWSAFRYTAEKGAVTLPRLPGGDYSFVEDINEAGQIVGYCTNSNGQNVQGVLWQPDGRATLVEGGFTYAINDRGQIAITWARILNPDGSIIWLETESPYDSFANDINNNGAVVGRIRIGNAFVPVVWEPVLDVSIDIKPGENPNVINLKSGGKTPVAVLTTPDFNAADADAATVLFADAPPTHWSNEDVDKDGDIDLILHFNTRDLKLTTQSEEATLTGRTFSGLSFEGNDTIRIVH